MAKGQRLAGAEVAVGEFLEVRNIGATDAGGSYCYLEFTCSWQVDRSVFLYETRKREGSVSIVIPTGVVEVWLFFELMRLCHLVSSYLYPKQQVSTVCTVPSRGQVDDGNMM